MEAAAILALIISVLKLLGILLLILIGILLLLLAVILFVPVRYSLDASYIDKHPDGRATVTWLFHVVRLDLVYDEDNIATGKLKIFGIPVKRFGAFGENASEGREESSGADISEAEGGKEE